MTTDNTTKKEQKLNLKTEEFFMILAAILLVFALVLLALIFFTSSIEQFLVDKDASVSLRNQAIVVAGVLGLLLGACSALRPVTRYRQREGGSFRNEFSLDKFEIFQCLIPLS